MSETRRMLVATGLGTVHAVHRPGASGRPLLLLHMSPRSSRMYLPVMERLVRPTLAIDRPGFGASDPPNHQPAMAEYAAASLEVVDELGWERFDVVGTHTGSVEAVEIARQAPHRAQLVTIVSIPAYTPQELTDRLNGVAAPRSAVSADGAELGAMWRRRRQIRNPPYDFGHLGELFTDEVISLPTVHWAYRAVLDYPMLANLKTVANLTVLAPHDDLWNLTDRARPSLPTTANFVELPHLDFDLWERAPAEMAQLMTASP